MDMRENGANGPGGTAGRRRKMAERPRKTAAPPEKPAKPPPAAGTGKRARNRRAEGLQARWDSRRRDRWKDCRPPRKPRERSPRLGDKDAARTAPCGDGGRCKNKNGRRRREKTEMQQQGRKQPQQTQGERAGPCACRYSPPAVPATASVRNDRGIPRRHPRTPGHSAAWCR